MLAVRFLSEVDMLIVMQFKDGDIETVKGVKAVNDFSDSVEIRTWEVNVVRYKKSEINQMEIIWDE